MDIQKKTEEGYKKLLGYDNRPNSTIVVEPEEARTVKFIYKIYIGAGAVCRIKRILEADHYKTGAGLKTWEVTPI